MADNNIQKSIGTKKPDNTHSPATEDTRDIFDKALDYAPAAAALAGGAFIGSRFMKGGSKFGKGEIKPLAQRERGVVVGRQQGRQDPTLPATPAPARPIGTGSLITGREIGSSFAPGVRGPGRRR